MSEPVMPFGKYKGRPLAKVPRGYIRFVLSDLDIGEPLRTQLQAVVDGNPIPQPPPTEDELIAELFARKAT